LVVLECGGKSHRPINIIKAVIHERKCDGGLRPAIRAYWDDLSTEQQSEVMVQAVNHFSSDGMITQNYV
jgi:hypothetical protein